METGSRGKSLTALVLAVLCLLAFVPNQAQATFPGRPGLIVFNHITAIDDHYEYVGGLHAIKPGWSHPRQLTDEGWDDEPSFAPSGKRLVFRRASGPEPGIYMLDLDSRRTRRLTSQEDDRSPAFGPRGKVVFSRLTSEDGSYDLFLRTPAGRLRQLTSAPADDVDPVFTPDGTRIVFTQDHLGDIPTGEPRPASKIYSIRADGEGLREIEGLDEASRVDISPDGRNLVFRKPRRLPNGEVGLGIWTRRLDGGKSRLITDMGITPVYSPTGRGIAYEFFRELRLHSVDRPDKDRLLFKSNLPGPHVLEAKLTTELAWQPLPLRR
jgi:Tol biopolymer transport system component